jgi:hypothetical protein
MEILKILSSNLIIDILEVILKTKELRRILREKNVPDYYYNLDNFGEIDQRVCLEPDGDGWLVYYSERGQMFNLVKYRTEEEACNDILHRLVE